MAQQIANPYDNDDEVHIEPVRDTQKITPGQMMYLMARKFPRSVKESTDKILMECSRKALAEEAFYSYTKGKQLIEGPSIRLAETIARQWGNMDYGVIEEESDASGSTLRAYCVDLETNTMSSKVFKVTRNMYAAGSKKVLTTERDIYENNANFAARRMRACILSLIPRDVVEAAAQQVNVTLASDMGTPAEEIRRLIDAFKKYGVTPERIAERLGHSLTSVTAAEVIQLRRVFSSIRDQFSTAAEEFPVKKSTLADQMSTAINKAKPQEGQRI